MTRNPKYGLGVLREGTITNDDLHEKKWNQLFIRMSGCSILLSHNLWFKVIKIKMKQGLLYYLINHRAFQVQSQ